MLKLESAKTRTILLNLYFIIFVFALIQQLIQNICFGAISTDYNMTEWLINYEAGFIRRGLRGEIILFFHNYLGLNPYSSINLITVTTFCLLSIFFVRSFIKKGYPIFILPCVFFLGNPILNFFILKTDSILCLLFIAIVYIMINKFPLHQIWINILFILGIFIHEIFFIMYTPVLILLMTANATKKNNITNKLTTKTFIKPCLELTPSFIAFAIILFNKGDEEKAYRIWQSWNNIQIGYDISGTFEFGKNVPGLLDSLSLTFLDGLKNYTGRFLGKANEAFYKNLYGPLMICFSVYAVYYTLSNVNRFDSKILRTKPKNTHTQSIISTVLLFQFIIITVLFAIGCDYGRWIFLWITSSFTILLLVPEDTIKEAIPNQITNISNKFNRTNDAILGNSRGTVYLISSIISFPLLNWYFPTNLIQNSSLYIVFSTISEFIRHLYK